MTRFEGGVGRDVLPGGRCRAIFVVAAGRGGSYDVGFSGKPIRCSFGSDKKSATTSSRSMIRPAGGSAIHWTANANFSPIEESGL